MAVYNIGVSDQTAYNDTPVHNIIATNIEVEAAALHEALVGWAVVPLSISDETALNESLPNNVIFLVAETEATAIGEPDPVVMKQVDIVLEDGCSIADLPLGNAILSMLISEGITFSIVLNMNGQEFVCWVANADTFAHSQYDGFDFDSMCRLGAHYYGVKPDGLYQLDGADDDGAEIPWFLSLPQNDAGTAHFKRVPRVYMGIRNDGFLFLRTITDGGVQRLYIFRKTSDSLAGAGQTLGRGVKSRYWGYDLIGIDGSDFELDQIEFFPVVLGRRVP